jgi:catechol 2,3-dioxygenase-like lactoylglutathione lyase family enzyme
MSTQISAITLGVNDINRARRFYSEGLGCPVEKDHGTFVTLSLGDGSSTLALYAWDALAADAGVPADSSGFRDFTLSWIAGSAEEVDVVLAAAERADAAITKPAKRAFWGGYSGYFTDPDGYHWKVASPNGPAIIRRRQQTRPDPDALVTLRPQETCVTIGASDIKRARRFYGEGLGCQVDKSYSKFVSFKLGAASSTLALYTRDGLAADAGVTADGHGFHGFTLSCIAGTAEEADQMLAAAERAGGTITKPAESESWGGYGGYFTDPDGNLWKVASGA